MKKQNGMKTRENSNKIKTRFRQVLGNLKIEANPFKDQFVLKNVHLITYEFKGANYLMYKTIILIQSRFLFIRQLS